MCRAKHGALVAILAALIGLQTLACSDRRSEGETATDVLAKIPVGWTKLPRPPEARSGAARVWTGSGLLVWGGCASGTDDACVPTADGFAFDPVSWSWERVPEAPLAATSADAIWTGDEAIFLHRVRGRLGGQAYDPGRGDWREVSIAPIAPRDGGVHVWTGSELIVWGGGRPGRPTATNGAAYDPAWDAWRPIRQAPIGLNLASGMWTGRELVVFGSLLDHRNVAETRTSVGAAYDPARGSWRELSRSRLSPQATSAVWLEGRMVAWDYEVHSQDYDTARDRWTAPIRMPFDFSECYPDSVVVGDLAFAFFCGRAALYDPGSRRWREIHGGPLETGIEAASLVPAGDVVFLAMDTRASYWAYRPALRRRAVPAAAATG
jgi:hypothetical protein